MTNKENFNEEINNENINSKEIEEAISEETDNSEETDYKTMYDELNKKYIYLYSDFENYKKRMSKENETSFEKGMITAIDPLLTVIDNFERALKAINPDENPDIYKGLELIKKEFDDYLKKFGISEIEAINEPFDPDYHNAAFFIESGEYDEPTVIEELVKGYKLGNKVIRYSVVKVAN